MVHRVVTDNSCVMALVLVVSMVDAEAETTAVRAAKATTASVQTKIEENSHIFPFLFDFFTVFSLLKGLTDIIWLNWLNPLVCLCGSID